MLCRVGRRDFLVVNGKPSNFSVPDLEIGRRIAHEDLAIQLLTGNSETLCAGGDFAVVLPGLGRKDEIGGVAAAVEKFKVVSVSKTSLPARIESFASNSTSV